MGQKKPFALGILVGRFQVLHAGHEQMIRTALAVCDEVGILIGSSQEAGTEKNPLTYALRRRMLEALFGDAVSIAPLPDIGVGNTAAWGSYVLEQVRERFGRAPDLLVSGRETRRLDWFDSVEGLRIAELYIPKTIAISASDMRGYMLRDDFAAWAAYTNPALHGLYPVLREAVLASAGSTETMSV